MWFDLCAMPHLSPSHLMSVFHVSLACLFLHLSVGVGQVNPERTDSESRSNVTTASSVCASSCGLKEVTWQQDIVHTCDRTKTVAVSTRQCFGRCSLRSHMCLPTATRVKKVRLTESAKQLKGSPRRSLSFSADGSDDPPWMMEVLEHVSCSCQTPRKAEGIKKRGPLDIGSSTEDHSAVTRRPLLSKSDSGSSLTPFEAAVDEESTEYYETCLACKRQAEKCELTGQVFDHEVCHCVYPASRTFLNSFYTLGVVMLTIMVCCFLVFGVQKGDENVLNSDKKRSSSRQRYRRSCNFDSMDNGDDDEVNNDDCVSPEVILEHPNGRNGAKRNGLPT